ncbi:MAG TPA: formylmethanofuran--tetrahydromethanopterin N-formyltransferase [Pirellulales bacterium]|jgi:formylmethanofuran--tetrahydromethanopterin N-formyltransferase|nr:formylmethanofuran--tetrahydromethanopterin N-formyltransferase [Pirellulales bacterium]
MYIGSTLIEATFAEAFRMRFVRLVVTAHDDYWRRAAASEATGYASSIIGCDAEAGIERWLEPEETPDRRPGMALLAFGFSTENLGKAILARTGQCLMTCPSTAAYDGLPGAADRVPLGRLLRFFGDGHQKSKLIGGRRYWRIPVMDGEFLVEESLGVEKGIGGGNVLIQGTSLEGTLDAARSGIAAVAPLPGVITPFPGGVARSGSKVGSRYKALKASTAEAFCPTLRGRVESQLHPEANCCLEIVIDGIDEAAIRRAMAAAIRAAVGPEIVAISAGNYGGKLGKFHFHLHELLAAEESGK